MPRKKVNKKEAKAKVQETTSEAEKPKLSELNQAHGKNEEKSQKVTLDQIWGDTGTSKYNTLDVGVYIDQLKQMNKSDLQSHATTVGIIPIDNRDLLQKRCVTEFPKYVSSFSVPKTNLNPIKLTKEAQQILSEGR